MINNVDSTNDGGDEQTYNKTNDSPTRCGVDIELTQYITHKNGRGVGSCFTSAGGAGSDSSGTSAR